MERFSPAPDEERLAELELLRTYLLEAGEAVERAAVQTAAPAERLKKLLAAPDKKDCLLEMAAANEIDAGFFALLDQNIEGARGGRGQGGRVHDQGQAGRRALLGHRLS